MKNFLFFIFYLASWVSALCLNRSMFFYYLSLDLSFRISVNEYDLRLLDLRLLDLRLLDLRLDFLRLGFTKNPALFSNNRDLGDLRKETRFSGNECVPCTSSSLGLNLRLLDLRLGDLRLLDLRLVDLDFFERHNLVFLSRIWV